MRIVATAPAHVMHLLAASGAVVARDCFAASSRTLVHLHPTLRVHLIACTSSAHASSSSLAIALSIRASLRANVRTSSFEILLPPTVTSIASRARLPLRDRRVRVVLPHVGQSHTSRLRSIRVKHIGRACTRPQLLHVALHAS